MQLKSLPQQPLSDPPARFPHQCIPHLASCRLPLAARGVSDRNVDPRSCGTSDATMNAFRCILKSHRESSAPKLIQYKCWCVIDRIPAVDID